MRKIIYTLGYGWYKKYSHEEAREAFQTRMEYVQRGIGQPIAVVDIRQAGSGSRNGAWFREPTGLCDIERSIKLMFKVVKHVDYTNEPDLANGWGSTQADLRLYAHGLSMDYDMRQAVERVKAIAEVQESVVVLMCGCKDAFKQNGTTWNCHRVPLADALADELGDEWSVIHL